ncbi:MAG: hypothetical protein OEQ53_06815 [Saprospiraceae bacterium]|nr:hypothetical protein [Saprospiraceae bacterium]
MKTAILIIIGSVVAFGQLWGQSSPFETIEFIIGKWSGTGEGFGNEKSKIESSYQFVMDGNYIEVMNESKFEPTKQKPEGGHHVDKGFISYDKSRKAIIFRQFNNEGYINKYLLNETLSNDSILVFETEMIENFVDGGKTRWTIRKISEEEIETTFDVAFSDKEYTCFGTNYLKKK